MRTKLSDDHFSCITGWQQHDEGMKTARQFPDISHDLVLEVCFVNFTGRRVQ